MTAPIVAAEVSSRSYSGGLSSPPMNTCARRNRMALGAGSSAAKWISRGRAAATIRSMLRAVIPPPGMIDDAVARPLHEFDNERQAFEHGRLLARGQHPIDAKLDQRLERTERLRRDIERAVEGHREGPGKRNQRARSPGVDFAVSGQEADDDAVGSLRFGGLDVGAHDREFVVVEQEVAAARPNDHMKADARDRPRLTDHAAAWRDPALEKVGAELDPLGPGSLGGADASDGIHAYLTDHGEARRSLIAYIGRDSSVGAMSMSH